jgi:23S rRNA pseudouridine1911/1915/1917 synthase
MPTNKKITVSKNHSGQRLDIFCVSCLPSLSRSSIQKAIKDGLITVNDKKTKPRYLVQANDIISVSSIKSPQPNQPISSPQNNLTVPIIYEDENLVVINKLAGVLVHSAFNSNQNEPTISSWFVNKYPQAKDIGEGQDRAGIVHRLDRDTSGVLVLAKNHDAYDHLKKQFKKRKTKKEYLALVFGVPKATDGRINQSLIRSKRNPSRRTISPLGKPAITEWKLEKPYGRYGLLKVFPYTGRTHQIRVHLHFIGHPIVGDSLYTFKRQSSPPGVSRHLLHAAKLTLTLLSGKKKTFTAPLPQDFSAVLSSLS